MIDNYLQHLSKKIDDKVSQLQESLADGNAGDFSEYKKMCGEVKGLLTARLFISDLQERLKTHDEDE
jgi:hypothetical protein